MSNNTDTRSEDSYIVNDIIPALADYGYPHAGNSDQLKIKDIRVRMGSTYKFPDVVYYHGGDPILLVEAKKSTGDDALGQAFSYVKLFPSSEYSKSKVRPKYFAVTEGKHIAGFYRYNPHFDERGELVEDPEPLDHIPTYVELLDLLGMTTEKPVLTPEIFTHEVFSYLLSAYAINQKKITPELIKMVVRQIYEYLRDPREYTTRYPLTELDGNPDRKHEIRRALETYSWNTQDNHALAATFQTLIYKAFQGASLNQYITPKPVVDFMINLVSPSDTSTVLDFECGSGSFLRAAIAAGVNPDKVIGIDIGDLPYYVTIVYLALYQCKFGADLSKIKISQANGLLYSGSADIVISNPAGGNSYDLDDIEDVSNVLHTDLDQNDRPDSVSEYYFAVQAAIKYAKSNGKICLVLPEGVFANSSESKLREFITNHLQIKAIVSLPRHIFYKGTTTRKVTSIGQKSGQKFSMLFGIRNDISFENLSTVVVQKDPIFLASVDLEKNLENKLALIFKQYQSWISAQGLKPTIKVENPVPLIKHTTHHQPPLIESEAPLFDKLAQPHKKLSTKIANSLKDLFKK